MYWKEIILFKCLEKKVETNYITSVFYLWEGKVMVRFKDLQGKVFSGYQDVSFVVGKAISFVQE